MKRPTKYVTVNSDASYSSYHKRGGYGFYIVSDEFKIQRGGEIKEVLDPLDAELKSLANALVVLNRRLIHARKKDYILVVNCDCDAVMNIVNREGNIKRIKQKYKQVVHRIWTIAGQYKRCYAKPIKGHKKGKKKNRHLANELADQLSRQYYQK